MQLPVLKTEKGPADFHLRAGKTDFVLQIEYPAVEIDFTSCWEDMGYRHVVSLEKEFAARARETAMDGIERRAGEGKGMTVPERDIREIIAAQAERRAWPEREFRLDIIPHQPPSVSVCEGRVRIKVVEAGRIFDRRV
ncbi:MAG: hypothetical protein PWQ91_1655 [Eubacteriales bacterium]|nr:hypothetical protein [Eubacteriales bacterium]